MDRDFNRNPVKAEAIKEQVKAAFATIPYPGDDNITKGSSMEAENIRTFFRGKTWQEITLEKLKHDYRDDAAACLNFMTTEAFQYYLPTYLMIAIDQKPESDVIPEFMVRRLSIPELPEGEREWHRLRVAGLNEPQRRAIKTVLQYQRELFEGLPYADLYAPSLRTIQYWSES